MDSSFSLEERHRISANLKNGAVVRSLVGDFSQKVGLSESQGSNLQLAVSEAFNNAVEHGFGLDNKQKVILRLKATSKKFLAEIEDSGRGLDFHGFGFWSCFSLSGERGRGMQIIAALIDGIELENLFPSGTRIVLTKWL